MFSIKTLFFLTVSFFYSVQCYNFLGIFPHPSRSHMHIFSSLMVELSRRGHNVTVVSTYPEKNPLPNFKDVDLSEFIPDLFEVVDMSTLVTETRLSRYLTPLMLFSMADLTCNGLSSQPFQTFLRSNESFDAILIEDFNSECYYGIAQKYKVPIIGMSSSGLLPWVYSKYGIPSNPAIVPNVVLPLTDKMMFLERLENTVTTFIHNIVYKFYRREKDKAEVKKYIRHEATDLENLAVQSSLMLVNTHYSLNLARPLAPNVIEVGGLHIKEPKLLPKNLKKWIEESPNGVIYFCMGSMTQGRSFPKEKRDAFLRAFDLLPHRVLWKYENESMEGITEKVLLQNWMPQLDVLCHPNVKLFISHGGLLGTMEAVYCGVPMVVMPQYGDQFSNAAALEANEGGVILKTSEVTEETAYKAMRRALMLKDKVKALQERFKDRPLPPLDTAVYWTEYVVKHKGAPFMKTAAVNMPFYQYYLLDVLLFLFVLLAVFIYSILYITKLFIGKLYSSKVAKNKKE